VRHNRRKLFGPGVESNYWPYLAYLDPVYENASNDRYHLWGQPYTPFDSNLEFGRRYIVTGDTISAGRYRVIAWSEVPYTNYLLKDYVPATKIVYSPSNKINFYLNPSNGRAGGWDFASAPD